MDYTLDTLGPRNFEHVVQALAMQEIGPNMSSFGDGPDGGREARWDGPCQSLNTAPSWSGYGVIQAKFRLHTSDPEDNYKWIRAEVSKELTEWANEESKRKIKPEFILFATNVRLSAASGGGKDKIRQFIKEKSLSLGLNLSDSRLWDYDDIRSLLDDSNDIRIRYAAFLTPGDVISRLMHDLSWNDEQFKRTMLSHAARTFMDDNSLNLTQAGAVSDSVPTVSDVVIDLPAHLSNRSAPLEYSFPLRNGGIVEQLLNIFNQPLADNEPYGTRRAVVIGGPGQGKSTVTQWIAQIYRANFLRYTTVASNHQMRDPLKRLHARCIELGIPSVASRRWPFRIILTEFADYLSASDNRSLLSFIIDRISHGSTSKIDSNGIIKWLESYPWVLLIDGLDEIPATSNRTEVMTAIRNFFLEVATVNGDVAVIATTRPQGYSDEFPPDKYMEFTLSPLDTEKALEYADNLIAIRHGFGTQITEKVSQRMRKAAEEPTTARLLETPLQVTILTVLLEKLGHAPRQRWRLFSQYYKVITQREQEKGGELSELLQEYESDVDFLHRHIGELLQHRGSTVGDTSSTISREEFDKIIALRLSDQGHETDDVERLRHNFSRLVTERLVFLALVTSDKIGFELRSLQEFMAAERVLSLPERDIIERLRIISISSYWRNVALFVAGGIFAARESLRADIIVLCKDMNRTDDLHPEFSIIRPGSNFALDILIDGSCNSQPIYLRGLADAVLDSIRGPLNSRLGELATITEKSTRKLIRQTVSECKGFSLSERENRLLMTVGLSVFEPEDTDVENIKSLINEAETSELNFLAARAVLSPDGQLVSLLENRIQDVDPAALFAKTHNIARFLHEYDEDKDAADTVTWREGWIKLLSEEPKRMGSFSLGPKKVTSHKPQLLGFSFTSIQGNEDLWNWILGLPIGHENWNLFREIGKFCLEPTVENLVNSLSAVRIYKILDYRSFSGIPWILSACIESALEYSTSKGGDDNAESFSECLGHLIQIASDGKMGNFDDWISAEERWTSEVVDLNSVISNFEPINISGNDWDNPVPSLSLKSGLVILGLEFQASHPAYDEVDYNIDLVHALIEQIKCSGGATKSSLIHLSFFFASIAFDTSDRYGDIDPDGRRLDHTSATKLRNALSDIDFDFRFSSRAAWLVFMPGLDFSSICSEDVKLMKKFGCCNAVMTPTRFAKYANIIREVNTSEQKDRWMLARLEMIINPESADFMSEGDFNYSEELVLLESTLRAWRIATADANEIESGKLDDDIASLPRGSTASLDTGWLMSLAQGRPNQRGISLAVRTCEIFNDVDPELAGDFLEVSNLLLSSMPVEIEISTS
ncbi:NACHT domain-containing protein [Rhodococcus globerulus]|uniref:NACHT domain-containing protein n=1 Tax=Rhodococcus globerulus TaxID=33008 RepID=UPI001F492399|nr:hypothetical protein [Rhodococcus globerulus]MCE4267224.1 hypothetical protein [Rhodococcus globerulus]